MDGTTKTIFTRIKKEIINLHGEWTVYRQLYGTNERRIDLLNASAPYFFHTVQLVLLDDIALTLSKLTDPKKYSGYENLSLKQLIERIDNSQNKSLIDDTEIAIKDLNAKCEKFREHRNKRIAHIDLENALKLPKEKIEGFSRDEIEKALLALRNLLNKIEYHFFGQTTLYEEIILPLGSDGEAVIRRLKESHAYKAAESAGMVQRGASKLGEYHDA